MAHIFLTGNDGNFDGWTNLKRACNAVGLLNEYFNIRRALKKPAPDGKSNPECERCGTTFRKITMNND